MAKKVGFITMGETEAKRGEIPEIGVGMLGYAFMGKAHSNACKKMPYIFWPPPAIPKLDDARIELFDNAGPNNIHQEPCVAAAQAGKHILCEKPLARNAAEAKKMLEAVKKAGVKHMCGFNYRFAPAVRLAKELIDKGAIGQLYHFRAQYLQEWIVDPEFPLIWRLDEKVAGSGALGDFSHIIDLARFLVGEPKSVSALTKTFIKERPLPDKPDKRGKVTVDDAFEAIVEYENGAVGTLEGSRFCPGRKNYEYFEINGAKGSIFWNLEKLDELDVYFDEEKYMETKGFHKISATESYHPFYDKWWPQGHLLGWENTFVNQLHHFIDAIVNDKEVAPYGATFEDGYRTAVICDAILKSASLGKRMEIKY
jgi:predicted dehydrogenase